MALQPDYTSGTITLTEGLKAFTTAGAALASNGIQPGDQIILPAKGLILTVETITGENAGTLTDECPAAAAGATQKYRIRFQTDIARVTAYTRALIAALASGNVSSLAGLNGASDMVLQFTAPGVLGLVNRTELVAGVAYNVQVANLAARASYNAEAVGFSVLVSNVGDGRAAVYSRVGAPGNWTAAAYVTGPIGEIEVQPAEVGDYGSEPEVAASPIAGGVSLTFTLPAAPNFEAGDVTTVAPGAPAGMTLTPVAGGYAVELDIPAGAGFYPKGAYSGATAYTPGDVVRDQGGAWIARVPTTGNAPPTLPTTINTWWDLLVRPGEDGLGTISTLVAGANIAIDSTDPTEPIIALANMAQATVKGRAAGAGTGAPTDLSAAQLLAIAKTAGAYAQDNALGTVSQSGGVPTGALMEAGSNANGQYWRYANGLQICTNRVTMTGEAINVAWSPGGAFRGPINTWAFPAAFASADIVTSGATRFTSFAVSTEAQNTGGARYFSVAPTSLAAADRQYELTAIGRWF